MAARYRACVRSRSLHEDPRGFTLPKSKKRTPHADDERVTERRSVGDDNVFSRSESKIEQPIAILPRTFEALDAARSVQRNLGEPLSRCGGNRAQMKTIIIFNFHRNSVPEKPGRKQVIKGVVDDFEARA
jgi:hypothetical protein